MNWQAVEIRPPPWPGKMAGPKKSNSVTNTTLHVSSVETSMEIETRNTVHLVQRLCRSTRIRQFYADFPSTLESHRPVFEVRDGDNLQETIERYPERDTTHPFCPSAMKTHLNADRG
jgi:hypothetical protein